MTIAQIVPLLGARVLVGEDRMEQEVLSACCSDLMSDVLAFVHERALLLTGIANANVIRTAQMLDLGCLVFVRGKRPDEATIVMARELGVVLLSVNKTMFVSAGLLYQAGLRGSPMKWSSREGGAQ